MRDVGLWIWRLGQLARATLSGFTQAGGTRLAAAIAYYALLSLFPLVTVLVSVAGLVVPPETMRDEVVRAIVDALPLTQEGDETVRDALLTVSDGSGAVGAGGFLALMWTASGMMGALRSGLTRVTGDDSGRPFLQGKLVDLATVLLTGLLVPASAALTVSVRVADDRLLAPLGVPGAGALLGVLAPIGLAFAVLAVVLRWMPARPVPWGGVWPGALVGSVGLWILATGFGLYVQNFGRYNAVYGSLGAVAAVMVFAFLAAIVLLVAATAAARWPEVRTAERIDAEGESDDDGGLRNALAGLIVRRR